MSTIHANTCIQTTMPLRNRWWFRWQCPVLVLRSCTSWNQGCQRWLLPEYSSAKYASAGYPLCFRGITTFFSKMGHKHIVHVTLSPCCRERRQSLSLQKSGHLIRQIWIRLTTVSAWGMLQERVYRSWIHDVSWKNVESWKNDCWGSGGCWTMHTVIAAAIA